MNDPEYVRKLQHNELALHVQPQAVITPLNDIQRRNLTWMAQRESEQNCGGFIFDEMGLGKTLTGLAHVSQFPTQATLIVCPKNVLCSWEAELKRHIRPGALQYKFYYGPDRNKQDFHHINVVLTTYTTVRDEYDAKVEQFHPSSVLKQIVFDRVILDEAHIIRNRGSQQFKAVSNIMGDHRWCFTGTPLWNEIEDLYALFHFVRSYPFADWTFYKVQIIDKIPYQPRKIFDAVCSMLLTLAIRHTKADILQIERNENKVLLDLVPRDQVFYKTLRDSCVYRSKHLMRMYEHLQACDYIVGCRETIARLRFCTVSLLTKLRQAATSIEIACEHIAPEAMLRKLQNTSNLSVNCCVCLTAETAMTRLSPCNHLICEHCEGVLPGPCPLCGKVVRASEKHERTIEVLPKVEYTEPSTKTREILRLITQSPGVKFVVFTVWLTYIDILLYWFKRHNIKTLVIQGSVSASKRQQLQEQFTSDASVQVMLCSLTASSVGLNLQVSNHVILADRYWNEACLSQASSRVERIGQMQSTVHMYHLIARDTIDEQIETMIDQKQTVALTTLTGTNSQTKNMTWANNIKLLMEQVLGVK